MISVAVLATVIVAPLVVNAITPRPLALFLRATVAQIDDSVTLGPYADRIGDVTASDVIQVPVDGLPDARLTLFSSEEAAVSPRPIILLIHGGGWILGDAAQIDSYAKLLAAEGYLVANLDYSLAPEYEYPSAALQSVAALEFLHENGAEYGGDPTRLFVGGNSAGAQLAAQVGAVVTSPALRHDMEISVSVPAEDLRGVVLYSGPYNFDTVERAGFPGFSTFAWSYLGRKDWQSDPRLDQLSVTHTATEKFPPTYMTSGDADPLEQQTYELDAVLRARGVDVTSRYWTGSGSELPHDYIYDLSTAEAQVAFDDTVAFIEKHSK